MKQCVVSSLILLGFLERCSATQTFLPNTIELLASHKDRSVKLRYGTNSLNVNQTFTVRVCTEDDVAPLAIRCMDSQNRTFHIDDVNLEKDINRPKSFFTVTKPRLIATAEMNGTWKCALAYDEAIIRFDLNVDLQETVPAIFPSNTIELVASKRDLSVKPRNGIPPSLTEDQSFAVHLYTEDDQDLRGLFLRCTGLDFWKTEFISKVLIKYDDQTFHVPDTSYGTPLIATATMNGTWECALVLLSPHDNVKFQFDINVCILETVSNPQYNTDGHYDMRSPITTT